MRLTCFAWLQASTTIVILRGLLIYYIKLLLYNVIHLLVIKLKQIASFFLFPFFIFWHINQSINQSSKSYIKFIRFYYHGINGVPNLRRLFFRLLFFSHYGPSVCTCLPLRLLFLMLLPGLFLTRSKLGSGLIVTTLSECVHGKALRSSIGVLVVRSVAEGYMPVLLELLTGRPKAIHMRDSLLIR